MIDILETTGAGTCKNCGRPITRLVGTWAAEKWSHNPEPDSGGFQVHCKGSPVAEPEEDDDRD
jgi:hypothetical protein